MSTLQGPTPAGTSRAVRNRSAGGAGPLAAHATFDEVVVPHLGAARRLAMSLLRDEEDAKDAVQEASLRALKYFGTFAGGNGRAWFLRIVRNTCHDGFARRERSSADRFDELRHGGSTILNPETLAQQEETVSRVTRALAALPARSRALLRHRELHGLSYQELAQSMRLPLGSVMSGLSRARQGLRLALERDRPAARTRVVPDRATIPV